MKQSLALHLCSIRKCLLSKSQKQSCISVFKLCTAITQCLLLTLSRARFRNTSIYSGLVSVWQYKIWFTSVLSFVSTRQQQNSSCLQVYRLMFASPQAIMILFSIYLSLMFLKREQILSTIRILSRGLSDLNFLIRDRVSRVSKFSLKSWLFSPTIHSNEGLYCFLRVISAK